MKNNAAMEDHWSNNPRFACRHNWHFVQGLTARLRCTRCGIMTWPKDAEQKVQEVLQDAQTDRELMQQALEALDSDNPDIQLRTAIALRERLAQPGQEPVIDKSAAIRIATALGWAPSKPWVGLTLEESLEFLPSAWRKPPHKAPPGWAQTVQAIEAKLKEKNT